ncbi:acetolactate synthase small subunit [Spirochaeta thermophila]|uniref:Acetolactate synthase small subunit n=1 Tax=Winmispira thermophila (strain ATCC 49972 / DSM 6192 / RI 19.B1) TaxID=665571 RepID=E0RNZ2_WINT6|nr:acetolactate synthase small subunit [Spirochaeta thermophila]ADN02654.1 acetolate synthase, small subunit [Spirochaeta thermophila DSM 6192]
MAQEQTLTNNNGRNQTNERHAISLYVANKPGVLIRIALVFARRGYNIDSLVVSESATNPDFSVMNIVATGERKGLEQVIKQLNKLVDVVHASDRTGEDIIQRELALIKVNCPAEVRTDILQAGEALGCEILNLTEDRIILQAVGDPERIDTVLRVFQPYGILESMRTGKVLMAKGSEFTP